MSRWGSEPDLEHEDGVVTFEAPVFDIEVDATSARRPATITIRNGQAFELTAADATRLAAKLIAAVNFATQANQSRAL